MKIAIVAEGKTERSLRDPLRDFLSRRLDGPKPALKFRPQDGRIPTGGKLKKLVELLLNEFDHVVALTDVYTGTQPPVFDDAKCAKRKMREWVGKNSRFHPHAAQYEFEAWLLPYWDRIQELAGSEQGEFGPHPEQINHSQPPSHRLKHLFRSGRRDQRREYNKIRDAQAILRGQDLSPAAEACPELREFLNTILKLSGGEPITT